MTDEPSDGARLIARGAPIRLSDGEHRLRFDYQALEYLEECFEGLDEFMGRLRETKWKAQRLRSVRTGIVAGLLHSKPQPMSLEAFEDHIRSLMEFKDFVDYLDALTIAIFEAFPAAPATEPEAPKVPGSVASPGNGSIGQRQKSSNARMRRSGE
jgi:hypothetical protein